MSTIIRRGLGAGRGLTGLIVFLIISIFAACDSWKEGNPFGPGFAYPVVVPAQDRNVPESVRERYREDAARLALHKVDEIGGHLAEQVELPVNLINTIYYALIHIYNSRLPARDSVITLYDIHNYRDYYLYWVEVCADTAQAWAKVWQNGQRFTGNLEIDRLIRAYDLQVVDYSPFLSCCDLVTLRSNRSLNTVALAKQFEEIDGVVAAYGGGDGGDGNNIKAESKESYWQFEYSIAWGDCHFGCTCHHFWIFRVHTNGKVEYAGSYGDTVTGLCYY